MRGSAGNSEGATGPSRRSGTGAKGVRSAGVFAFVLLAGLLGPGPCRFLDAVQGEIAMFHEILLRQRCRLRDGGSAPPLWRLGQFECRVLIQRRDHPFAATATQRKCRPQIVVGLRHEDLCRGPLVCRLRRIDPDAGFQRPQCQQIAAVGRVQPKPVPLPITFPPVQPMPLNRNFSVNGWSGPKSGLFN